MCTMTGLTHVKDCETENRGLTPIAAHGGYFAFSDDQDIILNHAALNFPVNLRLLGHGTPVAALCMNSNFDSTFLASSGSAYVILWDVEQVVASHRNGEQIRGRVLQQVREKPHYMSLSPNNSLLCVLNQEDIYLIRTEDKSILFREMSRYTNASFISENKLVATLENGKVQVWDINNNNLLWQSTHFSGSMSSLATNFHDHSFVLGFSNGLLRAFISEKDIDGQEVFKKTIEIDTDKELFRYNSSSENDTCTSGNIISTFISAASKEDDDFQNQCKIFCATHQVLFVVDSLNQNVDILPFQKFGLGTVESVHFCQFENSVIIVTSSLFESKISILKYCLNDFEKQDNFILTILPTVPLLENSILKMEITKSKVKKQGKVKDNPLTFHTRIKSSGYTAKPTRQMFVPQTSKTTRKSKQEKTMTRRISEPSQEQYWTQSILVRNNHPISEVSCNINHISTSDCNRYAASSLSNNSIVISQRSNKGQPTALCGHNGSVLHSDWSNNGTNIITCSTDCTAKIWSYPSTGKPILNFENTKNNSGKTKEKISKEVTHAQFYYIDKFIVLSYGNIFGLYTYYLDTGPKNDVKRYLETNKYKLVKQFQISEAQAVTGLSAPNNVYSYIVLACGSDKSLRVYDMNIGKEVAKIAELHTRPANRIVQSTGSSFLPCSNYNIFATSAASDGIKLWDIRSLECVMKFSSHPNTGVCPFDMSPCGKYVATAGDDRALHLYDVRKTSVLQTSQQQKEKFSSIAFSKDGCEIVAGLFKGNLISLSTS